MKTSFLTKRAVFLYLPLSAIAILIIVILYLNLVVGLTNGYMLINNRLDAIRIEKHGDTVVPHTIVDFSLTEGYLVGLRLPGDFLECENGTALRIVLKNKKEYFVLNTNDNTLINYTTEKEFSEKLKKLGINDSVQLDYSSFKRIWDKYSRFYKNVNVSECKKL